MVRLLVTTIESEKLLKEFLTACDSKWRKTTPPKELVGVIEKAREYLGDTTP